MNKKTYGEGVRTERTDHEVVAKTIEAKERLREQLGEGEEVRTEELSKVEFLARKMLEAGAAHDAAMVRLKEAQQEEMVARSNYQIMAGAWLKAKAEEELGA